MSEYKGLLAKKIDPPNPFDLPGNDDLRARFFKGDEDGLREDTKYSQARVREYVEACAAREVALFAHFEIDRNSETAWRDLALALAANHVPAYKRKPGKPTENLDKTIVLALDFAIIKLRDECSEAEARRKLANVLGEKEAVVARKLDSFKKGHGSNYKAIFRLLRLARVGPNYALTDDQIREFLAHQILDEPGK